MDVYHRVSGNHGINWDMRYDYGKHNPRIYAKKEMCDQDPPRFASCQRDVSTVALPTSTEQRLTGIRGRKYMKHKITTLLT